MLTANCFALVPVEPNPQATAAPKCCPVLSTTACCALLKRMLIVCAMLAMTLGQATGTALAQDPPATDSETVVTETEIKTDTAAPASEAEEPVGLDKKIDAFFGWATWWLPAGIFAGVPIMTGVSVPWVLFPLVLGAIFFTLVFGFPNIRYFGTAINIVAGKYDDLENAGKVNVSEKFPVPPTTPPNLAAQTEPDTNPYKSPQQAINPANRIEQPSEHEGEVSHFQALTAALSGTVGLGNIAGVAIALSLGGPGATFWMIVCGLLGMSTKFVECTLGVTYREIEPNGTVFGGPMYYLSKGLGEKDSAFSEKSSPSCLRSCVSAAPLAVATCFNPTKRSSCSRIKLESVPVTDGCSVW